MGQNLAKYLLRYLKRLRAIERKKVAITKLENAVSFYANSGMDPKNRQRRFLTIVCYSKLIRRKPSLIDVFGVKNYSAFLYSTGNRKTQIGIFG